MDTRTEAEKNLTERLARNSYPGRGLVLGRSEAGDRLLQVYWIMGRSPNSRNRIFATDGAAVWTEAANPAELKDPSLIIYHALRELPGLYVVTNGDQTDTICEALLAGGTFEQALATRAYEPDAPNFTPRISGLFDLRRGAPLATLCVLRRSPFGEATDRLFWQYESIAPGLGYCLTTYLGDGQPLPAFQGEPFLLPLRGDLDAVARSLWQCLNAENRVSLCAKSIDPARLRSQVVLYNKYEKMRDA
jgi:hypothetical protein